VARLRGRSLCASQLCDEAANPGGMQRDRDTVGRDVDPLDQQPQDPRLLGRVELVPDRLESADGVVTSLSSTSTSSAVRFSRCTVVIVRATSSGDASRRRTCASTRLSN
jgi:hypothetical protein